MERNYTVTTNNKTDQRSTERIDVYKGEQLVKSIITSTDNGETSISIMDENDDCHCDDGPAFTENSARNEQYIWCKHGKRHRCDENGYNTDLPAVYNTDINGNWIKQWWIDGKICRRDPNGNHLPAIETNHVKTWYVNDCIHRCGPHGVDSDLPAKEFADGTKIWYKHGLVHRCGPHGVDSDLPAIERTIGYNEWYVNGKRHRDNDLPAIEWTNGDADEVHQASFVRQAWYVDDQCHRVNGPAKIWSGGYQEWWTKGVVTRIDR